MATPLHFAASKGHHHVVKWLIEHGAAILPDKFGRTPIDDAEENGQEEVKQVINDPLGQTHSRAWKLVLFSKFEKRKSTYKRTDDTFANDGHYWSWLWVGQVDHNTSK